MHTNNSLTRYTLIHVIITRCMTMSTSPLSPKNLIFKTNNTDEKIYVREQHGVFQQIRRSLAFVLIALFILIPFIQYDNRQAIYIDLVQQQMHIFAFTLFPQDLVIFSLLLIFSAFLLFYLTHLYGRIWCGFTCPQTIWMLLFNWVERRIEGTHHQSKALDKQALNLNKLAKKTVKHAIWLSISLLTALVFISYFVPVNELYYPFFTYTLSSTATYWVVFFAVCTYINAGWIKEKMCQHMCPYSRFQSVMFDQSTKLVTYDATRGEKRGKRKRSQEKPAGLGDCVDCDLCVQVCPVGIDIRNGLQYECINCGLCVDACNSTMTKFNYKPGLIAFTAQQLNNSNIKKHISYGVAVILTLIAMMVWAVSWQSYDVNILRDRQALYNINHAGKVENTYLFKIRNKSASQKRYEITLTGLHNINIVGGSIVTIQPNALKVISITLESLQPQPKRVNNFSFNIKDTQSNTMITKESAFYSRNDG